MLNKNGSEIHNLPSLQRDINSTLLIKMEKMNIRDDNDLLDRNIFK